MCNKKPPIIHLIFYSSAVHILNAAKLQAIWGHLVTYQLIHKLSINPLISFVSAMSLSNTFLE